VKRGADDIYITCFAHGTIVGRAVRIPVAACLLMHLQHWGSIDLRWNAILSTLRISGGLPFCLRLKPS
jgi:hypothetical protein